MNGAVLRAALARGTAQVPAAPFARQRLSPKTFLRDGWATFTFSTREVAAKHPLDQPMHHQLRGVSNYALVQSIAHSGRRLTTGFSSLRSYPLRRINKSRATKRSWTDAESDQSREVM